MPSFKMTLKTILLAVCLTGCSLIETPPEEKVKVIRYYKDTRTNLCFVENRLTMSHGFQDVVFSYVPCSPEVESLIKD